MSFKQGKHCHVSEKKGRNRKILSLLALSVCALSLTLMCIFSTSNICYAVSYDGEVVGQVSSRAELNAAVEEAETAAQAILGDEEPVIVPELTVTALVGSDPDSVQDLAGKLVESVEGIDWRWAVTVDGEAVGTLGGPEELDAIIEPILDRYTTENTVSVFTQQEVACSWILASSDLESDPQALSWLLDPENTQSPYRLTVVTREARQTSKAIPFETEIRYDETGYSDELTVDREGQEGVLTCNFVTELENGQTVSTQVLGTCVSVEPVSKIITVGAIPGSRTDSKGYYIWPTVGLITSEYGWRVTDVGNSNHMGVDIGNSVGTDIWAADGGQVIYAGNTNAAYGLMVKILHDNGEVTCYAHLSKILVEVGDKVAQGQIIAKMGMTGYVTGPHLHFEVRPDGENPVDPLRYLEGWPASE